MGQEQSAPAPHPRPTRAQKGQRDGKRERYRSGTKRARDVDSSPPLEHALELLEANDFSSISHAHFPQVKGALSWAKLGDYVVETIKKELHTIRSEEDLREAAHHARTLASRLHTRDGVRGARTTRELRDSIGLVASLTKVLMEMERIRSGELQPNHDNGANAQTVRQRWVRLGLGDNPWIKRMVEQTVANVLASGASAGVKSLFTRAAATWLPPPTLSPEDGEQVEWSDDDM